MKMLTLMALVRISTPTTDRGSTTVLCFLPEEGAVDRAVTAEPAGAGGADNGAAGAPAEEHGGVGGRAEAAARSVFIQLAMERSRRRVLGGRRGGERGGGGAGGWGEGPARGRGGRQAGG